MVEDQIHQLLAAATTALPSSQIRANSLPLSFSFIHGSSSSIFENCPSTPHLQPPSNRHGHQIMQQPLELQYLKQGGRNADGFLSKSLDLGHPWSQDEVLSLFRVRSDMENWFPEFTWEHVSRKMEEIGFRRSPQKCKEKFEEESRCLETITNADDHVISFPTKNTTNYRLFGELEELCHHSCEDQNHVVLDEENPQGEEQLEVKKDDDLQGEDKIGQVDQNDGSEATDHHRHQIHDIHEMDDVENGAEKGKKKRKNRLDDHEGEMNNISKKKLKLFKSFCEDIASKMIAHQEELHNKILEDLIKREEEKIAREEAWKKQDMERISKEMEARARDQAIVDARQAKIIELLKKLSNSNSNINDDELNPFILCTHQNPTSSATHSSSADLNGHIPTSSIDEISLSQTSKPNKRPPYDDDCGNSGKRWPREEVIALINIRCNHDSTTNNTRPDFDHNGISNKINAPLWDRISKSMMEVGYNRSPKRCKEKWENINKYFRKTKDLKRKRSADSRTCPYFHHLSHLYSHGRSSRGSGGSSLIE